jgi:hypothetical protein
MGGEISPPQRSVSVRRRVEVIITQAPSTLSTCETHVEYYIEKSIARLAPRLYWHTANSGKQKLRVAGSTFDWWPFTRIAYTGYLEELVLLSCWFYHPISMKDRMKRPGNTF